MQYLSLQSAGLLLISFLDFLFQLRILTMPSEPWTSRSLYMAATSVGMRLGGCHAPEFGSVSWSLRLPFRLSLITTRWKYSQPDLRTCAEACDTHIYDPAVGTLFDPDICYSVGPRTEM